VSIETEHKLRVNFELPKGVWIGSTTGGGFYLYAYTNESPERALDLAREAIAIIEAAVELDK